MNFGGEIILPKKILFPIALYEVKSIRKIVIDEKTPISNTFFGEPQSCWRNLFSMRLWLSVERINIRISTSGIVRGLRPNVCLKITMSGQCHRYKEYDFFPIETEYLFFNKLETPPFFTFIRRRAVNKEIKIVVNN